MELSGRLLESYGIGCKGTILLPDVGEVKVGDEVLVRVKIKDIDYGPLLPYSDGFRWYSKDDIVAILPQKKKEIEPLFPMDFEKDNYLPILNSLFHKLNELIKEVNELKRGGSNV